MTGIKIYGERNSGTNYIEQLIANNINCLIYPGSLSRQRRMGHFIAKKLLPNALAYTLIEADRNRAHKNSFGVLQGWKHAQIPCHQYSNARYKPGTCFLTLTKNPYAWLLSLYKRPYQNIDLMNCKINFSTFLRTPWKTIPRECGPQEYANPIKMWNMKTSSYSKLSNYGTHLHLCYEDVLEDPESTVALIASSFGFERSAPIFRGIEKSIKHDNFNTQDYIDYYLNQGWQKKLLNTDIEFINTQLDISLVEKIGYKIIAPI